MRGAGHTLRAPFESTVWPAERIHVRANDKTFVVTGGGSGMGRELVLLLLNKGARVAALDINGGALTETAALAGGSADLAPFTVNITDRKAVEALPEKVLGRFGNVDGLLNNAGIIQPMVKVADLEYETIERVMSVNFYGLLYMTKTFLPYLLQRPEAHIVNTSSMGGFLPVPGQTIYGASKAAVKLFTEGLNSELQGTNVKVTVVFPGAIATNIATNSGLGDIMGAANHGKTPRTLSAKEAARIIVEGMERDHYRVLVGRDATLMDALYRLEPKRAAAFIYRQMRSILSG